MSQQVLYLDGGVVSGVWKLGMKGFDQRNGMSGTVEKIRVTEGDVLSSSLDLLTYICQHHFSLYDEEAALVYWKTTGQWLQRCLQPREASV